MKALSTLLIGISLVTATTAFARDDRGRTRTYTGMTPFTNGLTIVCPPTGSRCYSVVTSSSSSSSVSSSVSSAPKTEAFFIAFLKKYVNLPIGWTGDVSDKLASFTKKSTVVGGTDSSFYVELYDYVNCDSDHIEARMKKAWAAIGKTSPERITPGRAYGVQGLAFSWPEPGAADSIIRHYCIVPLGHIMTSHVWTNDADVATKNVIERNALPDLYKPRRGR